MLELNQRWIHFYGVTVNSAPADAPAFNMEECVTELRKIQRKGHLFKLINKGTACIRVSKMLINLQSRRATFLFQYSDSKISDPAFSDLESGILRSEPKLQGEGVAVSAHAIFYLDPIKPGGLEYMLLLEDSPGIGKTKLTPFLNGFLKKILSRQFTNLDDNQLDCYPFFNFDHFASQSLTKDLEDGELKFIELIKNRAIHELDEEPYLDKSTQIIKVKAVPKTTGQKAVDLINKVKSLAKEKGYSDIRVVLKKSEGKQRSVKVSTFREDAGEALFGRMEVVSTDHDLHQCAPDIDLAFIKKMRALK